MNHPLSKPLNLGEVTAKNRVFLAPLMRCRAIGSARIPNELMTTYYRQRASAGLILTEATSISPMGVGYADTPGIWTPEQVLGWKQVTQAVHEAGGLIYLQLWHVGRVSDPYFLNQSLPVAPSSIAFPGNITRLVPEHPYVIPRSLELREIPLVVESYKIAGHNAQQAGFDGVEIHGANGYLIEQFLLRKSNHRTDEYGGSLENRARLFLEITDALIGVWGAGRVGAHISPQVDSTEASTAETLDSGYRCPYEYVAKELSKRKISFLFAREGKQKDWILPKLRKVFDGPLIANQELDVPTGTELVISGLADAIAWGRHFISNPTLPTKIFANSPLTPYDATTFYGSDAKGYTDYT